MWQQLSVSTFQYFPKLCKLFSVYKWESLTDYASYMYRLDIKSFEFEMCGEVRSVRLWGCVEICIEKNACDNGNQRELAYMDF